MTGETDDADTERTAHDPPEDARTRTVKFGGGGARRFFINLAGSETDLGKRIAARGYMEPVPFTALELKALAYDYDREWGLCNSVMNSGMRVKNAIRELEAEDDGETIAAPAH